MEFELNHLQQPVGMAIRHWTPPAIMQPQVMAGRLCRLEPLNTEQHAAALYQAYSLDREGRNWTYLPYGPFAALEDYLVQARHAEVSRDPQYYAIIEEAGNRPVGIAAYLRIDPAAGSIEVGGLNFSPLMQRTPVATEAMYLMMKRAFDSGYRRYEWKCNALNEPSRKAAQRLGFSFEGIFRQAIVVKGRNRDTAWYSIIDPEWPALKPAFEQWLAPENFDSDGRQRIALSMLTAPFLKQKG